jgi:hypothetical protein
MVLWMQMVERDVSQCRGRSKRTAVSVENIRVQIGNLEISGGDSRMRPKPASA